MKVIKAEKPQKIVLSNKQEESKQVVVTKKIG